MSNVGFLLRYAKVHQLASDLNTLNLGTSISSAQLHCWLTSDQSPPLCGTQQAWPGGSSSPCVADPREGSLAGLGGMSVQSM